MTAPGRPRGTARGTRPDRRRVVVTGIGAVSSIGTDTAAFLEGLRAGRDGSRPITRFDTTGFDHVHGCQIDGFDPGVALRRLRPEEAGRATQFAAAASRMALESAGLAEEELRAVPCVVAIGTTDGEAEEWDSLVESMARKGFDGADLSPAVRAPAGRLTTLVARELGLGDAEAVTFATACAAGNYAIGAGFDAVAAGDVRLALCGGAESMGRLAFAGFTRLGAVASRHCRPFDKDRDGILTGEGGAVLVLEDLESALARGARILAEVLGYGLNCDANHPVAPDADSVADCIRLALDDAGVAPGDVDFVSAHGTATRANDAAEAGAVRAVFGPSGTPPTVGLKSMLGHSMGAASALASVACVLSIVEGFIPPTINHRQTDPECAIDCVPNVAVDARPSVVQNNALAFGGNNAVVLFGRYDADPGLAADRTSPVADGASPVADGASPVDAAPRSVITAWSALSPLGMSAEDFVAGVRAGRQAFSDLDRSAWTAPYDTAGLVPGFDIKQELGRKGVRSLDRRIGLSVTAVKRLLQGPDGDRIPGTGPRTAVVLGTSTTPAQAMFEFGRDTWAGDKPYHVDAGQFTTMVMNASASQCAIWHGLKGVNATVAAGRAAGLAALRYGLRLRRAGRAEAVICGAAIEFTDARAWMSRAAQSDSDPSRVLGEGAVTWLLESAESAAEHGRPVLAEVVSVEFAVSGSPAETASALEAVIRRVLAKASVTSSDVWAVLDSGAPGPTGAAESAAVDEAVGAGPRRISCAELVGDTEHASAAFQIGAVLAHAGLAETAGRHALVVCADVDGLVGCALLKL